MTPEQRKEMIETGLCLQCWKPSNDGRLCSNCRIKARESSKRNKSNKIKTGLCVDCGGPKEGKQQRCYSCSKRKRTTDKERTTNLKKSGICGSCAKRPTDDNSPFCSVCKEKKRQIQISRRLKFVTSKLCRICGTNSPHEGSLVCENCIFKTTARKQLKDRSRWQELKLLLEQQRNICPYTGIHLIPGVNASLDHIVPKSKGGDNSSSNIQWTHHWINLMKNDIKNDIFQSKLDSFLLQTYQYRTTSNLQQMKSHLLVSSPQLSR